MTPIAVVLDTNVIVSALLKSGSKPALVVALAVDKRALTPCYDRRMMAEYRRVVRYEKFRKAFDVEDGDAMIGKIADCGSAVRPLPLPDVPFADESDRPFYEVAVFCNAPLITGNGRHYPDDPCVMQPDEFLERCGAGRSPTFSRRHPLTP